MGIMVSEPDEEGSMTTRKVTWASILLLFVPQVVLATITFHQLDGHTFTISHYVKWVGGRAQAMDVVYEKAASLCIAAGFSHLVIVEQESDKQGVANATVTVQFFQEDGEGRVACDVKASQEYITEAAKKLDKQGYKGPTTVEASDESQKTDNICTVEQITTMAKIGITDSQIEAACAEKIRVPDESQKTENICTVDQITAMAKVGITDSQIKAACAVTVPKSDIR
jgi:hypothetical protein